MKVSLVRTKTFRIEDPDIKSIKGRFVVWWYGPLLKNHRAATVPMAIIFFRRLKNDGSYGEIIRKEAALTHLGSLRIGSIWEDGVSTSRIKFQEQEFKLSFSSGAWTITSPKEAGSDDNNENILIPRSNYKLYHKSDRNHLLNFSLLNNKTLIIPCLEFFIRLYGRSEEVKRILATYPWDQAQKRLFLPPEDLADRSVWPVTLASAKLSNNDAPFLAHVYYDNHAKLAAKNIYAQIETAFNNSGGKCFLKVEPWFQGSATLKISGMVINGGNTFLGLNILGGSEPNGKPILLARSAITEFGNLNKEPEEGSGAGPISRNKTLHRPPDTIELADDQEPDHGASSIEILEDEFEILGERRQVIVKRRATTCSAKQAGAHGSEDTELSAFSTGESYGSGKGIGHASINSPITLESHGILRDMWNAVLYLKKTHPETIRSADWFTFESGFSGNPEPKLISMEPFDSHEEDIDMPTKKWVYYDVSKGIPRGVLVIRLITPEKAVYLCEIQRRQMTKTDSNGDQKQAEEPFKGMVFVLGNDSESLKPWLRTFLSGIRNAKGITYRLEKFCPGTAHSFKHATASDEQVPCEAAVRNALKKVEVTL